MNGETSGDSTSSIPVSDVWSLENTSEYFEL